MRLDLHIHSIASDGVFAAEEVLRQAAAAHLDVIALADHDTIEGIAPAREEAASLAIEVVPAIEVSTTRDGMDIHVLGYFIDPESVCMIRHQERAARLRLDRIQTMLERLEEQGLKLSLDDVLEEAGPRRHIIGRPHLARAMVTAGHVRTVPDAFNEYIGDRHPAFVPTDLLSPREGIELILDAGGIPVWAHPHASVVDELLPEMIRAGLRGLEVYRPRTPAHQVLKLEGLVRSRGLLKSGGSDWHGPDSGPLGTFHVSSEEVAELLAVGGL